MLGCGCGVYLLKWLAHWFVEKFLCTIIFLTTITKPCRVHQSAHSDIGLVCFGLFSWQRLDWNSSQAEVCSILRMTLALSTYKVGIDSTNPSSSPTWHVLIRQLSKTTILEHKHFHTFHLLLLGLLLLVRVAESWFVVKKRTHDIDIDRQVIGRLADDFESPSKGLFHLQKNAKDVH